jgi:hypothetical protein
MDNKLIIKKYAVCIFGQLRAIDTVIKNFNNFLIKPLDADLYVLVQESGTDIDKNINLFETDNKIIYNPPDTNNIFVNLDKLTQSDEANKNYIIKSHLNIYYNFYKLKKTFGDIFEKKYKYIILTRSDYLHLFNFPDILKLTNKNNTDLFWCYDGHEYGGINNTLICVPSKYIKDYLSSAFNYLQNSNNINRLNNLTLNIEQFYKLIFDDNKWKIGKIQHNAFLTASNINGLTTCKPILYSEKHNVFYKYIEQLTNSFDALNIYNKNNKWKFVDNKITLDFSYSIGQLNYRIIM